MANEVVRYNNAMNEVAFRKFNSRELDLFFSICSKLKRKGTEAVQFNFDELRELVDYKSTSKERLINDLQNIYGKMLNLNFKFENDEEIVQFVLFTRYKINKKLGFVEIAVNTDFEFILNEITGNFTRFELEEFTGLKSSYSKALYRKLKQFRSNGIYLVSIEEFRRLLDIPEYYRMGNIDQKIFAPIKKELSPLFNDFNIKKIKKGRGQGGKVVQLQFTFKEKDQVPLNNWLKG